jgi:hypothetical protein
MARTYAGLVFLQRQQVGNAMAQLRTALQIDPTLARAQVGMGRARLYRQGRRSAARLRTSAPARSGQLGSSLGYRNSIGALGDRGALREIDSVLRVQPDYPSPKQARDALTGHLAVLRNTFRGYGR